MMISRKMAGYILILVGVLSVLVHVLAVSDSDPRGLPTLLGLGVLFLLFGILTTITCLVGERECEVPAP